MSRDERELLRSYEQGELSHGALPKYGSLRKTEDLKKENEYLSVRRSTLARVLEELVGSQDPNFEQRVFELRKKIELEYSLFQELKKQLFQLEMQRIFIQNRVRSFEKARESAVAPSLSLKKKMGMAVLLALLMGGFAAYGWELIAPRIKGRGTYLRLPLPTG